MTARNKNRPGYKKTPVGWIPAELDSGLFATIATVIMGQFPVAKELYMEKCICGQ